MLLNLITRTGILHLNYLLNFLLLGSFFSVVQADDTWKLSFSNSYDNFSANARESAVFSPDGKIAAICCQDKSIRLWDLTTGRELRRLVGHGAGPVCMAFSPDGERLVSSAPEEYPRSALHVWSVATGEALFVDKTKSQSCFGVAWHPDGKSFVTSLSHIEFDGRSAGYSIDTMEQKGRAFGDVQVQVYTNRQATVTNVKEGLAWLQRSCTESDVAVVLFSGHGVQKERGLYCCTHETQEEGLQYTALNWETVGESLRETRARQILFLSDACHAGAFGNTTLASQQALATSLRDAAGVMYFASSAADEVSVEDPKWAHGAFCKAVLDGLAGACDADQNGRITVQEFCDSVCREVPAMTGNKQHPQIPDLGSYDPDLVLSVLR
ncbi:MAG: caspase family protein [Planctomycetaceae bacterium]|nr:caspase family protein [Planctomycetaceae bacterium]